MISEILDYTKKYFPNSLDIGEFAIISDGITGSFTEIYAVGQYVNIQNSLLNDGTYKITAITSSKLTLDDTLLTESSEFICLWGLMLPKGLLTLISDIITYKTSQTTLADVQSESQGNRSITYVKGSSWQSAFKSQLSQYRSMYDDRRTWCRRYNITTKGW